ncbi:MAG: aspartyl protease family protein [Dehalococcoidia bacterium]
MVIKFEYEEKRSDLFGKTYRPVANAKVQNAETGDWKPVEMLVDSGADYTLFPFWYSVPFGIDLARDCTKGLTSGVGGDAAVYLYQGDLSVRVGPWERKVPVGFLDRADIPPLLGRQAFLDTFTVVLSNHQVYFTEQAPRFDQ